MTFNVTFISYNYANPICAPTVRQLPHWLNALNYDYNFDSQCYITDKDVRNVNIIQCVNNSRYVADLLSKKPSPCSNVQNLDPLPIVRKQLTEAVGRNLWSTVPLWSQILPQESNQSESTCHGHLFLHFCAYSII